LRLGAALWSFETLFWEPQSPKNQDFQDFHDFHNFQFFIKETGLEDFNRPEVLHASSF